MPGHITHVLFASCTKKQAAAPPMLDVYNGLYSLGAQGPDIFFYYAPGFLSPRMAGFGSRMHKSGYADFVANLASIAAKQSDKAKNMLFAYAAGLATHYFLDRATHPYVYARTEIYESAIKNSAAHRNFETNIDTLLHTRLQEYLPHSGGRYWQYVFCPKGERRIVAAAAADAARAVYGQGASARAFLGAMGHMIMFTRMLQSKRGHRRRLIAFFERPLGIRGIISNMVHIPIASDDKTDYLGEAHAEWAAPWSPEDVRRDGFMDMFYGAKDAAAAAVRCMYDVVYSGRRAEDLREFMPEGALAKPAE